MSLQDQLQDPVAVAAREASALFYLKMDGLLADRDYLAGAYSFADIAFYMAQLFGERMGAVMDGRTPRLLAWRERLSQRPAVREVAGAMAAYLQLQGRALPDFLAALLPSPPTAPASRS